MISPIAGWTWSLRASGILMTPRQGGGAIRYTERVRPLRRPVDAVRALVMPADYSPGAISDPEPFVTDEGEYGALLTVDGTLGGSAVRRTLALVFADDFYSLTVGIALQRDQFAPMRRTVAEVARRDRHMLGLRRRRFRYQPPRGWQGIGVGPYHAKWFPPGFPLDGSSLAAYPALPATRAETVLAMHVRDMGLGPDGVTEPTAVVSRSGLSGRWWRASSPDGATHDCICFEDDRYVYPLVLISPPGRRAANEPMLRQLLDSVEAIPRGNCQCASSAICVSSPWED